MRKIILLLLLLPMVVMAQEKRTGQVSKAIAETIAEKGKFDAYTIANPFTKSAIADYDESVTDGMVFSLDQTKVQNLLAQNPKQMNLTLPFKSNDQTVSLDLIQVEVFAPDFKAVTSTGEDITKTVDFGKHYRGIIEGNQHSLVSISIFGDQISGFIANDSGTYSIGKIRTSDTDHIMYRDTDLQVTFEFDCTTENDGVSYTVEQITPPLEEMDPGDEVDIYIEAGRSVYNIFGQNLPNTVAFLTSLFTQCYVLYANDGILARTSNMLIWVTQDPYDGGDSFAQLSKFTAQTDELNGDLGHLVMMQNYGGVAAGFSGICPANSDNSLCYSGLVGTSVPDVPIYSFNVFLIAHEMGHLLGSRHTHACVWNGNNTAIDSCAGFTEGGCALPGNPPGGGTIMSYCANTSVGIDFTQGFGPQPQAVILNNIEAVGNCLDPQDTSGPPVAVCNTLVLTLDGSGSVTIDVSDIEGGSYDDNGTIVSTAIDQDTFTCDDVGINNVTLTVTDNDGLTSTCVAYVEVIDDTAVTISCPADVTVTVPAGTLYALEDFQDQLTVASEICADAPYDATFQSPSAGTELDLGVHVITINVLLADGSVESCTFEVTVEEEVLGLDDNILSSLVLYPNPAVDNFFLSNPQNLELETISIYDMTGRLVKSIDLNEMGTERMIDVSDLTQSNYFAVVQGAEGKIVKQLIKR